MNLAQTYDAHFCRAERCKEFLAIFQDVIARIPFREAEIQDFFGGIAARLLRWKFADAAWTRAEAVHQPVQVRQCGRCEKLQTVAAAQRPGWLAFRCRRSWLASRSWLFLDDCCGHG